MNRPGWDEWGLSIATAVATRGECLRSQVGAVILDRDHRVVAAGYNGTFPGGASCLQGACPRATSGVLPGSSYDTGPGACISVHAEINCILDVSDRSRLVGGAMYVTRAPCDGCHRILLNTSLDRVVYPWQGNTRTEHL